MRDKQVNQPFEYETSVTPEAIPGRLKHAPKPSLVPRGLFSRIIKRLGLEKELAIVRENLKFFTTLLVMFLVLSVFAFIGIKDVLATSNFGPFLYLAFSDPGIIIKYWHSFLFAAFESMPGVAIAGLIFSLAFLILFVRFAVFAIEKTAILIKSINKQKYGSR